MIVYCPVCRTKKPMVKAGYNRNKKGKKQRYVCTSRPCRCITVNPLKQPRGKK